MTKYIPAIEVQLFLKNYLNCKVENFVDIQEGKHSDAFSYSISGKDFIVRINTTNEGFLKDKFANENFSNLEIITPKIFGIGEYNKNLFFCISEKISGETVKEQYSKEDFSSLITQFELVEAIKRIPINPNETGFGKWKVDKHTEQIFDEYFTEICTGGIQDWKVFETISYFNRNFVDYLLTQVQKYSHYSINIRELVHGDFGSSNLFLKDRKVSGIIDWAHSFYGDHFWDVGRIVLFCPNRNMTTQAALDFYQDLPNYRERIAWGVYCVMLKNYRTALQNGQEISCTSSPVRIQEIERVLNLPK